MSETPKLGSIVAAEGILEDLYVRLRRDLRKWAALTRQTPQARMGYVGQHLVSAVTGFEGGRSGARGMDLVLPDGQHAEIKTCSRVDQLGTCAHCGSPVSAVELECGTCGLVDIERKDDSKWLISPKTDQELRELFEERFFYLVLFDFVELGDQSGINARIWRVDPRIKAFAYCMVDYYRNIRTQSASKAPFNLWPFKLKFDLMLCDLIFHAQINPDDSIQTLVFENEVGPVVKQPLPTLEKYSQAGRDALTAEALQVVASHLGLKIRTGSKKEILAQLEIYRARTGVEDEVLADVLCDVLYGPGVTPFLEDLPDEVGAPSIAL